MYLFHDDTRKKNDVGGASFPAKRDHLALYKSGLYTQFYFSVISVLVIGISSVREALMLLACSTDHGCRQGRQWRQRGLLTPCVYWGIEG